MCEEHEGSGQMSKRFANLFWFVKKIFLPWALFLLVAMSMGCTGDAPSVDNSGQKPPGKLSFDHTGITTNCASCHSANTAYNAWPESGHRPVNGRDCSACHNTRSWKAGANPHGFGDPAPTQCIACHAGNVPNGYVGTAGMIDIRTAFGGLFDHSSHGGTNDCIECHMANQDSLGVTWKGGVYSHYPLPTKCSGCHTPTQRPTGSAAGTIDHDQFVSGNGDCGLCHGTYGPTIGRTWSMRTFVHSPVPVTCAGCHAADKNFVPMQYKIVKQMNHSAVRLPDCAICHASGIETPTYVYWRIQEIENGDSRPLAKRGVFHRSMNVQLGTCRECHLLERPVKPVGAQAFDHNKNGTGDCVGCHAKDPAKIGITWKQ